MSASKFWTQSGDWWIIIIYGVILIFTSGIDKNQNGAKETYARQVVLQEACSHLSSYLKFKLQLKPKQRNAVECSLNHDDVLAVPSTEYGKSLIFQLCCCCFDWKERATDWVCLLKCIIADQKHGYSSSFLSGYIGRRVSCCHIEVLPSFSLIREHPRKRFKLSVSLTCYRQIGSQSTNHIPLAWRKEGQKVTIVAVTGGFRSDLSITPKTDGSFGDVSSSVLFSKVAYQPCLLVLWFQTSITLQGRMSDSTSQPSSRTAKSGKFASLSRTIKRSDIHLEVLSAQSRKSFEYFLCFHRTLGISLKDLEGFKADIAFIYRTLACSLTIWTLILLL